MLLIIIAIGLMIYCYLHHENKIVRCVLCCILSIILSILGCIFPISGYNEEEVVSKTYLKALDEYEHYIAFLTENEVIYIVESVEKDGLITKIQDSRINDTKPYINEERLEMSKNVSITYSDNAIPVLVEYKATAKKSFLTFAINQSKTRYEFNVQKKHVSN